MSKIEILEAEVKKLYEQHNQNSADWANWLWQNHVTVTANYASDLAQKYGADKELARASALLHDIADAIMKRNDPRHEEESLKMARELLQKSGFSEDEVNVVVDDAIRFHSCHDGQHPRTKVGKILATADSLAHLKTDFYIYATWALSSQETLEDIKKWVLGKIERDLNSKIFFEKIKKECEPDYERIKVLFSR